MRRFVIAVSLSSLGLWAQDGAAPAPNLQEYQNRAMQHLWQQPGTKQFDPDTLPMEKIMSSASIAEGKCAIDLLRGKADWTVDPRVAKPLPAMTDTMPRLRLMPVCTKDKL